MKIIIHYRNRTRADDVIHGVAQIIEHNLETYEIVYREKKGSEIGMEISKSLVSEIVIIG